MTLPPSLHLPACSPVLTSTVDLRVSRARSKAENLLDLTWILSASDKIWYLQRCSGQSAPLGLMPMRTVSARVFTGMGLTFYVSLDTKLALLILVKAIESETDLGYQGMR